MRADCLVVLAENCDTLKHGDHVEVKLIPEEHIFEVVHGEKQFDLYVPRQYMVESYHGHEFLIKDEDKRKIIVMVTEDAELMAAVVAYSNGNDRSRSYYGWPTV